MNELEEKFGVEVDIIHGPLKKDNLLEIKKRLRYMQHRERIALEKICAEIDMALKFVKKMPEEEFLADEKTKSAIEKILE